MKPEIKVVSFDVDGTLVDKRFNDLVWEKEIPALFAQKEGLGFEEARKIIRKEYDRIGERDLRWYDLNYWIDCFDLKVKGEEILYKYESEIRIYPEVPSVLSRLRKKYPLVVISMMPYEFLTLKLKRMESYFNRIFSTISDFKDLKTPQGYLKICQILGIAPFQLLHIGDHRRFDYLSPRKIKVKAILIDRERKKVGRWTIKNLKELEPLV